VSQPTHKSHVGCRSDKAPGRRSGPRHPSQGGKALRCAVLQGMCSLHVCGCLLADERHSCDVRHSAYNMQHVAPCWLPAGRRATPARTRLP
jgi:hypothetical protein